MKWTGRDIVYFILTLIWDHFFRCQQKEKQNKHTNVGDSRLGRTKIFDSATNYLLMNRGLRVLSSLLCAVST